MRNARESRLTKQNQQYYLYSTALYRKMNLKTVCDCGTSIFTHLLGKLPLEMLKVNVIESHVLL